MGIIYTGERDTGLQDLTQVRPLASLPFAGRYRIIDFILSNMVRSGITNIGVVTQNNYASLMDHLGSGIDWDLDRKRDGLFIFPPIVTRDNSGWYKGCAEAFHAIDGYIRRSRQRYIVVSASHIVCSLSLEPALNQHIETGADITLLYYEDNQLAAVDYPRCTFIQTASDGRVYDIAVRPRASTSRKVFMEMYIMSKELFLNLVGDCVAHGDQDLVRDVILKSLQKFRVYAYRFNGYVARIDSVQSYFEHSMALLNPDVQQALFVSAGKVFTKVKNEAPTRHGAHGRVSNCLVANGCELEGEIENSIIFRGVRVDRGARVCNSILMQGSHIGADTLLEQVLG
jgi:glucose-1-phosphate adenylyltransferase